MSRGRRRIGVKTIIRVSLIAQICRYQGIRPFAGFSIFVDMLPLLCAKTIGNWAEITQNCKTTDQLLFFNVSSSSKQSVLKVSSASKTLQYLSFHFFLDSYFAMTRLKTSCLVSRSETLSRSRLSRIYPHPKLGDTG